MGLAKLALIKLDCYRVIHSSPISFPSLLSFLSHSSPFPFSTLTFSLPSFYLPFIVIHISHLLLPSLFPMVFALLSVKAAFVFVCDVL